MLISEVNLIELTLYNTLNYYLLKLQEQNLKQQLEFQKNVLMMFGLSLIQILLGIFLGIKLNNLLVDWLNMKLSYKKRQELLLKIELLDLQNTTELRQKEKEREEKKKLD